MAKQCIVCGKRAYSNYCVQHKPRKRIPQQSAKEMDYQYWKETEARPFLIKRDGNECHCCGRPALFSEKLDIEHTEGKGSHPERKRDLTNLRLFCRYPCHDNKTNNRECIHVDNSTSVVVR